MGEIKESNKRKIIKRKRIIKKCVLYKMIVTRYSLDCLSNQWKSKIYVIFIKMYDIVK